MTDRVPGAPGQYQAVLSAEDLVKLQNNEPFTIKLTRDDKPIKEGTPYNKASVLPDELAATICPDIEDPTPADAFLALYVTKAPAIENTEFPGCYYRMVDGEKEWMNPPMELGVEYRTTERWKGKPVYIKAVNIGTLSATANALASVDSSVFGNGVDDIVDIGGSFRDGSWSGVLPYCSNTMQIYVFANKTGIAVWSTKDGNSCYTATVWVKYTKS